RDRVSRGDATPARVPRGLERSRPRAPEAGQIRRVGDRLPRGAAPATGLPAGARVSRGGLRPARPARRGEGGARAPQAARPEGSRRARPSHREGRKALTFRTMFRSRLAIKIGLLIVAVLIIGFGVSTLVTIERESAARSEERRVGKECRSRGSQDVSKEKKDVIRG